VGERGREREREREEREGVCEIGEKKEKEKMSCCVPVLMASVTGFPSNGSLQALQHFFTHTWHTYKRASSHLR